MQYDGSACLSFLLLQDNLTDLTKLNIERLIKVYLYWIPDNKGIPVKKQAEELVRTKAYTPLISPEYLCRVDKDQKNSTGATESKMMGVHLYRFF